MPNSSLEFNWLMRPDAIEAGMARAEVQAKDGR